MKTCLVFSIVLIQQFSCGTIECQINATGEFLLSRKEVLKCLKCARLWMVAKSCNSCSMEEIPWSSQDFQCFIGILKVTNWCRISSIHSISLYKYAGTLFVSQFSRKGSPMMIVWRRSWSTREITLTFSILGDLCCWDKLFFHPFQHIATKHFPHQTICHQPLATSHQPHPQMMLQTVETIQITPPMFWFQHHSTIF